ncbi:MAG: leucyl aminopeptidase [Acidobacteriota bacterium]|nr:leucyl aminopeptidase [Acidobacteriota bacterium]
MATPQQPLFDSTRFDPGRTDLPPVELVKSIGRASDVIVGLAESKGRPTLVGATAELEKLAGRGIQLLATLVEQGAQSRVDTIACLNLPGVRVLAVGLGDSLDLSPEDLRRAAGIGVRHTASIASPSPRRIVVSLEASSDAQLQAVVEGALLGSYDFVPLRRHRPTRAIESIGVLSSPRASQQALDAGRSVAHAVCVARDWTNLPANLLGPSDLVEQARSYLKDLRVGVDVLDEHALAKAGFGGILAVGGGSARPPRLLRLDWHPRGARKHLVLVGKGITYDSGGYNLKPAESLLTMKHDMAGAAAVIAATHAIAELGLGVHVTTYAPIAESMISGNAYRPGDVLTIYDGTTVENIDSDCEGRIVLADALARAKDDLPDLLVDVATLTGACMIALGTRVGGLMTNEDATADQVLDAAEIAGEEFWQLPITSQIRSQLSSEVADLRSKKDKFGGALFAAAFLQHFVADGTSWAHLDIAGPAWNREAAHGYVPTHATGAGVRTLIALAQSMAS